ncbi:MAG TPA: 3-hydroxyacyl-CoA dehydrogenase NAD-binding domain-containing protein [Sphingomonas sp.]|nr:3-hydroxyacyl-CoA dehydrogenase NAD-binding domain-containing protein [Sphingomonas sp.]
MEIRSEALIAVVGAGTMGAGIAQVAAAARHKVVVIDAAEDALKRGRATVAKGLEGLIRRGKLDAACKAAAESRIDWTTDLARAAPAALAIEAIIETIEAKRTLFASLSALLGPEAILASNTSSLSITALAEGLPGPERFLGLHFFNPVPVMKLVEVVAHPTTDPVVKEAAAALMRRWGKHPVAVRDVPGFIVNRVARPYYAEGFAALGEGMDPAAVDHALTAGGGFRMGPLALADLIGQDVNYAVACSVFDAYEGQTRFRPQESQRALAESGRLGRKTGAGVYDYSADLLAPSFAKDGPRPRTVAVGDPGLLAPLVEAARAAGLTIQPTDLPPATFRADGVLLALGDGRPLAERQSVDVLIDHTRDFASAETLLFTPRAPLSAAVAAGFARAIGRKALLLPDRPGQLVLRTLAQLANAAADAVTDEVASAGAIDEAMRYGANHPEGPLAWSNRVGHATVRIALEHIAEAIGDPIYRPSSLFAAP